MKRRVVNCGNCKKHKMSKDGCFLCIVSGNSTYYTPIVIEKPLRTREECKNENN